MVNGVNHFVITVSDAEKSLDITNQIPSHLDTNAKLIYCTVHIVEQGEETAMVSAIFNRAIMSSDDYSVIYSALVFLSHGTQFVMSIKKDAKGVWTFQID